MYLISSPFIGRRLAQRNGLYLISQRAALVKHGFALPLPAELYGGGPTKRHLADVYRKVQQRQFRVASVTDSPAVRPGAGYQFYGFRFT